MKQIVRTSVEILTVVGFAASVLAEALRTDIEPVLLVSSDNDTLGSPGFHAALGSAGAPPDIVSIVQQPVNGALWALLVAVILAAGLYLVLRWQGKFAEPLPTSALLGLCAAAIWPWIVSTSPAAALIIAALAPLGVIAGLVQERHLGLRNRGAWPLAVIAGWLLMGGVGALSALLHLKLHVQIELAALAGLLVAALIGGRVQLSLGSNLGFAGAIIWAMLGIAAASLDANMTVATACVLGIAAMVVVLVRVTT